jgi:hypothetical protein
MKLTHKHHIEPKYRKTNNRNRIELSVQEHAEAHRVLYEQDGNWQDLVAWKCLSGAISKAEAIRMAQRLTSKDYCKTEAHKAKLRQGWLKRKERYLGVPWNKGLTKETSVTVRKISNFMKKAMKDGKLHCIGDSMRGKSFSKEHRQKLSDAASKRRK